MKNSLFVFFFFIPLFVYSQTISVTAAGSVGVSCSEYVNQMNRIWEIDIPGNRTNREIVLEGDAALRSSRQADGEEEIVFKEKTDYPVEDKIYEADIRIYPNPTGGRFAVEIAGIPNDASIEIYLLDMSGKLVEKKSAESEKRIDFDLSRETTGTYILNINIGGKISTWKVIKK